MSKTAFEVTTDDVAIVLSRNGVLSKPDDPHVQDMYYKLDLDRCGMAALEADDMDDQTELAYKEIERQLQGNL